MDLRRMPYEVLCEIVKQLPQEDRPAFYRSDDRFGPLFAVPALQPLAIYGGHLRHGYTVAQVWETLRESSVYGNAVALLFPPDVGAGEEKMWQEIVVGLCKGGMTEDVAESEFGGWVGRAVGNSCRQRAINFLPESTREIELFGVPQDGGLDVFRLALCLLFGNGKSRIKRLTLGYADPSFETWEILSQFLRLSSLSVACVELTVKRLGRPRFCFFGITSEETYEEDMRCLIILSRRAGVDEKIRSLTVTRDEHKGLHVVLRTKEFCW